MAVPYLSCMALVASLYGLPPRVLPSIQAVEGGRPGTVHVNADGSQDLGVMQVNTRWLPALSLYTGLSAAAVRDRLLHRACFNIAAAGAIMRTYLDEAGGDLMQAVGGERAFEGGGCDHLLGCDGCGSGIRDTVDSNMRSILAH